MSRGVGSGVMSWGHVVSEELGSGVMSWGHVMSEGLGSVVMSWGHVLFIDSTKPAWRRPAADNAHSN